MRILCLDDEELALQMLVVEVRASVDERFLPIFFLDEFEKLEK